MEKREVEGRTPNTGLEAREPATAASRMLQAVSSAAVGTSGATELDAAARTLVTELRLANEPPEQVLVQIKQILAEAGLRPSHGPADSVLVIERHVALYRSVIESSIRHYFASVEGDGGA
jgi:hypothetical protein